MILLIIKWDGLKTFSCEEFYKYLGLYNIPVDRIHIILRGCQNYPSCQINKFRVVQVVISLNFHAIKL